ncbi:hypothetical protein D9M71_615590 [compost metagenome]
MSGTAPCAWWPQKNSPVRAKPDCTSSAMNSPPALRTSATAWSTKPRGTRGRPSLANRVSISSAAGWMPSACSEAIASPTFAAYSAASCASLTPAGALYRHGIGTARACAPNGSGEGRAVVTSASEAELPW